MANYFLVGLGNPGEEYENTRHNTGRMIVDYILKKNEFSDLKKDGVLNALMAKGKVAGKGVIAIEPETFMNKSGSAVAKAVKSKKDAERLVVVYDDIDLPLGTMKISWNRSSGGHNGLESVIRAVKTQEFVRFRIGISPANAKGAARKPKGEDKVIRFIIGKYKEDELKEVKKIAKKAAEAFESFVECGKDRTMTEFN